MLGSVMEWTGSYFGYYPYDPVNELPGGYNTKVIRGAVHYTEHRLVPVTYRVRFVHPGDAYYFLGFRCARDVSEDEQLLVFIG